MSKEKDQLLRDFEAGNLNRRETVSRLLGLGLAAPAIYGLLDSSEAEAAPRIKGIAKGKLRGRFRQRVLKRG